MSFYTLRPAVLQYPEKTHANRMSRGCLLILNAVGNIAFRINLGPNIGAKL